MAIAFSTDDLRGIPPLYRMEAERFIQFFDNGLIPLPGVDATGDKQSAP